MRIAPCDDLERGLEFIATPSPIEVGELGLAERLGIDPLGKVGRVNKEGKPHPDDERPPICPACGVTMGMVNDEDGKTRYVCLECGFSDSVSPG